MPRTSNSNNNYYNYILIIDNNEEKIRTCKCLAERLDVSLSTIQNYLNNRTKSIRKFKENNISIEKCKNPIYKTIRVKCD